MDKLPDIFKNSLIRSCRDYYRYISNTNKGLSKIKINKFEIIEDRALFYLNSKLLYTDNIFLEINGKNYKFDDKAITNSEQDDIEQTLFILITKEIKNALETQNNADCYVVSDLKFLIERLGRRYVKTEKFVYPSEISVCKAPQVDFLSREQQSALNMIFEKPISYVWGAPGTGKTKTVLAQSLIRYINYLGKIKKTARYDKGQKILVVAPTNNAVEQILEGLITELKNKNAYYDNCILRLGMSSASFAKMYPECIELSHFDKMLSQNIKRKDALIDYYIIRTYKSDLTYLDNTLKKIINLTGKKTTYEIKLDDLENELLNCNESICHNNYKLKKLKNFILKFFCAEKIERLESDNKLLTLKSADLEEKTENIKYEIKNLENNIMSNSEKASFLFANSDLLKPLFSYFKKSEFSILRAEIKKEYDRVSATLENMLIKYPAWKSFSDEDIEEEIFKYSEIIDSLNDKSTLKLVEKSDIIACTIDTLISRVYHTANRPMPETDTEFQIEISPLHIFIDEAAYCPVIKFPVLFDFECPITLLGDHKQLPPVCELNKDVIVNGKNNQYDSLSFWDISSVYIDKLCFNQGGLIESYKLNILDNPSLPARNLTSSYRFGTRLAKILDKYVYKNGLSSNINTDTEIYYVDAPLSVKKNGKTEIAPRTNLDEIYAIKELLLNSNVINSDFAILTPYSNQAKALQRELRKDFPQIDNQSKILTVHKSQGREWDNVIFSVVDNNIKSLWFSTAKIPKSNGASLINTAISRAKKRLILVLNKDFWQSYDVKGDFINELVSIAKPLHFEDI